MGEPICPGCETPVLEDEGRECGDCRNTWHTENQIPIGNGRFYKSCFSQHAEDTRGCGYEDDSADYL